MTFHHVALYAENPEAVALFYEKYFNLCIIKTFRSEQKITGYHLRASDGGFVLEILKGTPVISDLSFHLGFYVKNVNHFFDNHKEQLNFTKIPFLLGKETIAFLADPAGYQIEINDQLK